MPPTQPHPAADVAPAAGETGRDPGVEANARLTAMTGLVLIVILFAEGLTIVSIRPLLGWHIAIGMALIPPVALKMASTLWRFGRYYLHDPRYRHAGPPHLILRALGPVVTLTTVAVLATGVASALAGPTSHTLATAHKATFVLWFGAMVIHVVAHLGRAGRLTRAELGPRRHPPRIPHPRGRQGLVLASVATGVVLGITTTGLANGWSGWVHGGH